MSRAQSGFDADAAYVWFVGHRAHILLLDVAYALFIWKGGRFMSKHRLSRTFIDDATVRTTNGCMNDWLIISDDVEWLQRSRKHLPHVVPPAGVPYRFPGAR